MDDIIYNKSEFVYKKGQFIFQEGAKPLGLYHIYEGKIKVLRHAPGGNEQVFRIASEGDFLGHYSFLTKAHYQISAMALEDCSVCLIPTEVMKGIFDNNKVFRGKLVRQLSEDIQHYYERIASLAYKSVRGRLAEALLELRKEKVEGDEPMEIIKISRQDLASLVGTVKETAIRTLSEFKEDGFIDINEGKITIMKPGDLERLSED